MKTTAFDPFNPIKILADGTLLTPGDRRTDHVGVFHPALGIIVHPVSLAKPDGSPFDHQEHCIDACAKLRVLGFDDWELALREDWNPVINTQFHNPAVDPNLYPGIKPGWHWTNSGCAWQQKDAAGRSPSAWGVSAIYGRVSDYHIDSTGFALAVRRVGQ